LVGKENGQKKSPASVPLRLLPGLLGLADFGSIEISGQFFVLLQPESLFQKLACFLALGAGEAMSLNARGTIAGDNHFDRLHEALRHQAS
jgi:hypothetical protein